MLQQLKQLLGVAHPHDQAPFRVALEWYLLEDAVPHVEVVLQDPLHARDRDVETLAVEQMGFDLLGSPDVLPPLDVLCDVLLQLVMPQLPSVPVCGERREGMLRESYRLDQIADERWLDIAQLGHLDLADTLLEHELDDLLQLHGAELVLRQFAPPLLLAACFVGQLCVALVLVAAVLLAASVQLEHGSWELDLFIVDCATCCCLEHRCLSLEASSKLRGQYAVLVELFLAQARGVEAEGLRLLLEAVRVENELAALHAGLFPNRLEVPVESEVFRAVEDHELLLLDQPQRLDPRPLQRLRPAPSLHLFLLVAARR